MHPPFFANPDNSHCLQATMAMALTALVPGSDWPISRLNTLCHKRAGEGTWTHGAYLALDSIGLEAVAIDAFDYHAFGRDPQHTLLNHYPGPVAAEMITHYDLNSAANLARQLSTLRTVRIESRSPTMADIYALLDDGWLIIANVNLATLDGRRGTTGHSVLLFDSSPTAITGHDPGQYGRGKPARTMRTGVFERAWSFMGEDHRELLAIR
ncbi:MAG: hypothetical protein ACI9MC_000064 [Kiritimatiellia bacterium]